MKRRAQQEKPGTIKFPGSPWPDGHRVTEMVWSGRIDAEQRLWFDLHLQGADYYEREPKKIRHQHGDDWTAPGAWGNHGSCILSSTHWPGQFAVPPGFLVATPAEPLDFDALDGRTFRVDTNLDEEDLDAVAFGLYLLGHDSARDHRITFAPRHDTLEFGLRWTARVAHSYVADYEYKHALEVEIPRVRFAGVRVEKAAKLDAKKAKRLLQQLVRGTEVPLIG